MYFDRLIDLLERSFQNKNKSSVHIMFTAN